jgi:phage tail-like protein
MDQHFDPYKNFRFRVIWDDRPVAGVSRIGALKRSTEVVRHSEGGDAVHVSRKSPGTTEYESVTLERGLTADREFEKWASAVSSYSRRGPDKDFRKDVRLEVYDERGTMVLAYRLFRCWVSEYQALPELDASSNAVAIETIKLELEGWEIEPQQSGGAKPGAEAAG